MIKASQINDLLEEWVRVGVYPTQKRVEVIINPSNWRDVARDLKGELQKIVREYQAGQILRYGYDPSNNEIRVWVGYLATHEQIYAFQSEEEVDQMFFGYIDVGNRVTEVIPQEYELYKRIHNSLSFDELPKRLQRFLQGTTLVRSIIDKLIR